MKFRRHPLWGALAATVAIALIVLTWQAAPALSPVARGLFLAMTFWSGVLALWELIVPLVELRGDELVLRPILGRGTQRRTLSSLTHIGHTDAGVHLTFARDEPIRIERSRMAPHVREALVAALRERVPSAGTGRENGDAPGGGGPGRSRTASKHKRGKRKKPRR